MAQADTLLLGEAGGDNPNPEETLTEAELIAYGTQHI
jgi:hypothetical protein